MLVILLGPSGVGKSAIIRRLASEFQWHPIVSYVTRQNRTEDDFKISVPPSQLDQLAASDQLWSDISQLGHRYVILRSDIDTAVASLDTFYVLDFSISKHHDVFGKTRHLPIVICAPSLAEILARLRTSGREDRTADASREYEVAKTIPLKNGYYAVHNRSGALSECTRAIVAHAEQWARAGRLPMGMD